MIVTTPSSMSMMLKLCSCSRTRVEVAVPAWTTERPPARVDEVARVLARRVMVMTGKQHVDAGFLDRVERELLPADRALDLLADLQREQADGA